MLLRASSRHEQRDVDLVAVNDHERHPGVEHGDLLRQLTEALVRRPEALGPIRDRAAREMGAQSMVDALSVAAAFNGITRVADSTGIPLDDSTRDVTGEMREATGIERFSYDEKSARYD